MQSVKVKELSLAPRKGRSDKGKERQPKADPLIEAEAKERLAALRRGIRAAVLKNEAEVFGCLIGAYADALDSYERATR